MYSELLVKQRKAIWNVLESTTNMKTKKGRGTEI